MAEETVIPPKTGGRQVIIIAVVATVVIFSVFLIMLRSFSSSSQATGEKTDKAKPQKLSSHVVIYSNLELKDAAKVITRLKDLSIPYQVKDEGRSIAVPRAKADEARLGLAEKNLPGGGNIGWEIFDQSKLGATDFDRRIQFVRAISGELSRMINRINVVENSTVQIVIPETKLFETIKAPVTASVLLKLKPGEVLTNNQVNAIIYLVSSSVENLRPDNITVVDTNGAILSGSPIEKRAVASPAVREAVQLPAEAVVEKEEVIIQQPEEKAVMEVQTRIDLEDKLTSKVQSLLNTLYPPNTVIAKASVDSIKNKKVTVIILVDRNYKLDKTIKKNTFDAVSDAVGYEKDRGDKIILRSVPFHTAVQTAKVEARSSGIKFDLATLKAIYRKLGRYTSFIIIGLPISFLILLFLVTRRGKRTSSRTGAIADGEGVTGGEETSEPPIPIVEQMKTLASRSPDQAADIIKRWVMEEGA